MPARSRVGLRRKAGGSVRRWGLALVLPWIWSCSTASWQKSAGLFDYHHLVVEIEQLTQGGEPQDAGFAHPATLGHDAVRSFLSELGYTTSGVLAGDTPVPLIAPDAADGLAHAMVDGLKKTGPAQRVRFEVRNADGSLGSIVSMRKRTRGVAFVKPEGVLNVAFDLVDEAPDSASSDDPFTIAWGDPTRRTTSAAALSPPRGTALYVDQDGGAHPLWIIASFEALAALARKPSGKVNGQHTAAADTPEEPKNGRLSDEEGIHRLKFLRELFEQGVITEEQYRKEREKIFEQY